MKNRILLILALAVLTLSATSCIFIAKDINTESPLQVEDNKEETIQNTDNGENSTVESTENKTEDNLKENTENINNPVPDTSKDTYYYVEETVNGGDFEITGQLESSEYVIYTNDNGEHYGICDMVCQVIVDPVFTILGWCPWHEVVYAEPFPEGTEPIVISDKYKIDVHYGHGGFGEEFYIYDSNTEKMYIASADMDDFYLQEIEEIAEDTPYILYSGELPLSEGGYYPGSDKDELYYIIDDLIFGSAEYEYMTRRGSTVNLGECERVDGFTNDYMMIKRDGKIGFVDLGGNDACEFIYTDAMRAYDSKAWVKAPDGLWKVVNLK